MDDTEKLSLARRERWGYYVLLSSHAPAMFMGSILVPVLCEQLAFQISHEKDGFTPCIERPNYSCELWFFGILLSTFSYTLVISAMASIVQALVLVPLSGLADLGDYRRYLILLFTIIGGISICMQIIPVDRGLYFTTLLVILGSLSTTAVSSYALSLVPAYARAYGGINSEKAAVEISSKGGALSLLCSTAITSITYGIASMIHDDVTGIKASLALGGAWWLIVGICGWMLLVPTRGICIPSGANPLLYSLRGIKDTVMLGTRLTNLFLAQLAFFLISEGAITSGLITILVARNELNIELKQLTIITVASPLGCSLGIIIMLAAVRRFGLSIKRVLISMSLLTTLVASLNVIGHYNSHLGLRSSGEVIGAFILSAVFYGPVMVSFRILLTEISPKGRECQLFTLNSLLSSGSAWIGSLCVLYIIQATGEIRVSGYLPIALILSGVLVLSMLDFQKARSQATLFSTS